MSAAVYTSLAATAVLPRLPVTDHAAVFSPLPHRSFILSIALKELKSTAISLFLKKHSFSFLFPRITYVVVELLDVFSYFHSEIL